MDATPAISSYHSSPPQSSIGDGYIVNEFALTLAPSRRGVESPEEALRHEMYVPGNQEVRSAAVSPIPWL